MWIVGRWHRLFQREGMLWFSIAHAAQRGDKLQEMGKESKTAYFHVQRQREFFDCLATGLGSRECDHFWRSASPC